MALDAAGSWDSPTPSTTAHYASVPWTAIRGVRVASKSGSNPESCDEFAKHGSTRQQIPEVW